MADVTPETVPAPDRGGPVGRGAGDARATMRAAALEDGVGLRKTGYDPRFPAAESSPVGSEPRWRVVLSWLLAVAACVAIAWAVAILGKAHLGQALLEVAWKRAQASGSTPAPWPWADTRPVAKLYAPRQQVERLLLAGANGRTLAWGPGIVDGIARPGERGNAIVTAHRDTHFRFLADVAIGDALVVERADGVRVRYRIVATRIADAESLAIPRDTEVPTLTLVTCWPFGAINPGGALRYVVVAEADGPPAKRMARNA
jgi:sortase A